MRRSVRNVGCVMKRFRQRCHPSRDQGARLARPPFVPRPRDRPRGFARSLQGDDPGFETVEVPSGEPVVIGVSTMLEGELASTGEALRDAAALAGEGRVAGHDVEFVGTDDACTIDGGSSGGGGADRHRPPGRRGRAVVLDAVLGSQPVYEAAGITHISQLSTNIATTDPEIAIRSGRSRTVFNDEIQGQQQAAFAEQELGAGSAFIVYEAFRYGVRPTRSGRRSAASSWATSGSRTADFPDIVSQITEADPDVVYYSGFYPTGIPFVQELRDGGYAGPVLAGDAMYDQAMIDGLGELAEQELYVTLPSPPLQGAEFEDFSASYQEAYGADPTTTSFTAESFDAATAIILGLQADGVVEETDGGIEVDLEALNEAIYELSFDGASGPVRFDDKGDRIAEDSRR